MAILVEPAVTGGFLIVVLRSFLFEDMERDTCVASNFLPLRLRFPSTLILSAG